MIKLLFSGDFAPLLKPEQITSDHFDDVQFLLSDCDLHVTNLECPLTHADIQIKKSGPPLKAHPDSLRLLKQANVSVACMANNHIFDYHEKGITDTLTLCRENQIDTLGIVSRPDGQHHWLIKEVKGKRIGFLNYCEHEFSVRDEGLLGANGYDAVKAFYDIRALRPQVDYLIVIYHGGNEYYPLPNPEMKKDFHYLADLGADAVIGHHTHVISGFEMYNGKPLVYSLGNFFFPLDNEPEEWNQGLVLKMNLADTITISLFPVIQCNQNFQVVFPDEETASLIQNRIAHLSNTIADDQRLIESWEAFARVKGQGLVKFVLLANRFERAWFKLLKKKPDKNSSKALIMQNLLRCKSLYNLLLQSLK